MKGDTMKKGSQQTMNAPTMMDSVRAARCSCTYFIMRRDFSRIPVFFLSLWPCCGSRQVFTSASSCGSPDPGAALTDCCPDSTTMLASLCISRRLTAPAFSARPACPPRYTALHTSSHSCVAVLLSTDCALAGGTCAPACWCPSRAARAFLLLPLAGCWLFMAVPLAANMAFAIADDLGRARPKWMRSWAAVSSKPGRQFFCFSFFTPSFIWRECLVAIRKTRP